MAISREQAESLHNFLGYGRIYAPLWFIGLEEGLGSSKSQDEVEQNLIVRSQWDPVMDMYKAHLALRQGGEPIDLIKLSAKDFKVWRWMARISLFRNGHSYDNSSAELCNNFIRHNLGRVDGDAFLTELSPIPKAAQSSRDPTTDLILMEKTKELLLNRKNAIVRNFQKHTPTVICYGAEAKSRFAEFLNCSWKPVGHGEIQGKISQAREFRHVYHLPFFGRGMSHKLMQTFLEHCEI